MSVDAEHIVKLFSSLDSEKATLSQQFEDMTRLVTPTKPLVITKSSPGAERGSKRFTSHGVQANQILSATLHGTLTPSTSLWNKFKFRDDDLNEVKDVADWLDDSTNRVQKALNASNFNTRIHESWLDLGCYGTTAIGTFERQRDEFGEFTGLMFDNFPIGEYVFTKDTEGRNTGFYRKFKLTAFQARDKFSRLPGFKGLGKSVEEALTSNKPEDSSKKFEFIHAIFPRDYFNPNKIGAENMPVESQYIAVKDKHTVSESGFEEFPIAIARWMDAKEDAGWGRGPGWVALPEIKTLNRLTELALIGLSKDISPPILIPHKGLVGGLKTGPNAQNYYKDEAGKPEYFHSGTRWDISEHREDKLKEAVDKAFLIDKLQLPERPDMTATEVTVRFDLLQRLLGPTFHRITTELLSPMLLRVFNIMLRADAFLPVPDEILQRQQTGELSDLDIEYIGPLARAQRQDEVQAIEATYQSAAMIAQARQDMSVFDNLDDDEALAIIADQKGLPAKILRDKNEVAENREQQAEQMAAQNDLEQLQQVKELGATG